MVKREIRNLKRIAIDTNILIYYFQDDPIYADKIEDFFARVKLRNTQLILSSIILTELLVKPIQEEKWTTMQSWLNYLRNEKNITVVDVTPKIAIEAATLRAKYNIKTPDSIHIATAIEENSDVFLGNDKKLQIIEEIEILSLEDI